MLGWTPNTFDALQNLMTLNPEGHGIWNAGRYSNPRVEALTLQIQREIDQDKRNALIEEAFQIHQMTSAISPCISSFSPGALQTLLPISSSARTTTLICVM